MIDTATVKTAKLHSLAADVAAELGDGWIYNEEENYFKATADEPRRLKHFAQIDHADGYAVQFWGGDKLSVSGTWPHFTDAEGNRDSITPRSSSHLFGGDSSLPSINVSADRGYTAIAREVERRLLPFYLPKWQACKAKADEWEKFAVAQRATRAMVAALPGVRLNDGTYGQSTMKGYIKFTGERRMGAVQINSPDSVEVTLHLTADELAAVLAALG